MGGLKIPVLAWNRCRKNVGGTDYGITVRCLECSGSYWDHYYSGKVCLSVFRVTLICTQCIYLCSLFAM